jgi:predicted ABC-type ATPase
MKPKLLAPNGKPSNLNATQYKLVRTPAFKKWFGDWENNPSKASKVVDENGEPLVVYHGTKQNFTVFNLEKVGSNIDYGMWGSGFYFSPIKSFSKNYGNVLMKIFLNIKNPFVRNPNLSGSTSQFKPVYGKQESMELRNKILDSNYDGVLQFESGKKNPLTQVVAFYPEQIKLANGTNTTFDSANDDIRFEKGGLIAPNGKPSNLNATQYKLVRTPSFKKWFGDWEKDPENSSKVIDENGEPLVVYHGTDVEFYEFKKLKKNYEVFWFTPNVEYAQMYSKTEKNNPIVLECFLNVKNPNTKYPFDILKYDGFIDYKRTMDYENWINIKTIQIVQVVNSNQIKLADGSNTTFDSSNNDIRYEYGGNTPKKDNMKKTAINWSEYYKVGGEIPKDIKSKIYDSNGDRRIDKNAIQALTDYAENLPQTKDANLDRNGDYTASRKKLHQRIINSFKDELVCIQKKEPIAILMGGSPASGKSTFLRKYAPYLLKEEILKVDADEIRAMLPEYKGWNATSTHLETKDIVNTLLSDKTIGIPCKYDVIYDGTMNSTKSYIPLMKLLKELGYKTFIVYIDKVPEEVVKKRALERYKKSGRFVPEAVIDDFFSRGKSALNELKEKADGYMIIDGSDGEYNILEQSGMRLPKRRLYSQLGQPIKKIAKN